MLQNPEMSAPPIDASILAPSTILSPQSARATESHMTRLASTQMILPDLVDIWTQSTPAETLNSTLEAPQLDEMQEDCLNEQYIHSWADYNWMPVGDEIDLTFLQDDALHPPHPTRNLDFPEQIVVRTPSSDSGATHLNLRKRGRPAALYTNGFGGRRSRVKAPTHVLSDGDSVRQHDGSFSFPETVLQPLPTNETHHHAVLHADTYTQIRHHFQLLCVQNCGLYQSFQDSNFPDSGCLNHFCYLYIKHCHVHLPILHNSVWKQTPQSWIVILTALSLGATYEKRSFAGQTAVSLREFVRRAIAWQMENYQTTDAMSIAQACLLNAILQMTQTRPYETQQALAQLQTSLSMYKTHRNVSSGKGLQLDEISSSWESWIREESCTRLLCFSWLIRTQWTLFEHQDESLPLPPAKLCLPTPSLIFECETAQEWSKAFPKVGTWFTLHASLRSLYVDRRAPKGSPVTDILLVYAVIAQTENIKQSVQQPFANWNPEPPGEASSDEDDSRAVHEGSQNNEDNSMGQTATWLPANSRYTAWRNGACDALDLLHWSANAEVHNAKGHEAPRILHLHLARLLLLCPFREIIEFAEDIRIKDSSIEQGLPGGGKLNNVIFKWFTLDDHKGRLGLVHAGAMIWHIRRYWTGMYYEPFCIFLSVLIIWMYGTYFPQLQSKILCIKKLRWLRKKDASNPSTRTRSPSIGDEDDLIPHVILLDRPCDDEIVQTFIRKGHDMEPHMCGAGNITLPTGQKWLLGEGMKILGRYRGVDSQKSIEYQNILEALLRRM